METNASTKQDSIPTGLGYSDGLPIQQENTTKRLLSEIKEDPHHKLLESFTITMSLGEYLRNHTRAGRDFITIDEERRQQIIKQAGWEKAVYIEQVGDNPCYRLFDIETWSHRETNLPELKQEKQHETFLKAKEQHNQLLQWKINARTILTTKGKLSSEQAERYIQGCISPESAVNKNKFLAPNPEGHLLLDEVAYHKAIGFYYNLRTKLNFPETKETI